MLSEEGLNTKVCCVPRRGEGKCEGFFFPLAIGAVKVKCQLAQEAEVFCGSAFSLNVIQSGSNQKFMYSDSSTVYYEK